MYLVPKYLCIPHQIIFVSDHGHGKYQWTWHGGHGHGTWPCLHCVDCIAGMSSLHRICIRIRIRIRIRIAVDSHCIAIDLHCIAKAWPFMFDHGQIYEAHLDSAGMGLHERSATKHDMNCSSRKYDDQRDREPTRGLLVFGSFSKTQDPFYKMSTSDEKAVCKMREALIAQWKKCDFADKPTAASKFLFGCSMYDYTLDKSALTLEQAVGFSATARMHAWVSHKGHRTLCWSTSDP